MTVLTLVNELRHCYFNGSKKPKVIAKTCEISYLTKDTSDAAFECLPTLEYGFEGSIFAISDAA